MNDLANSQFDEVQYKYLSLLLDAGCKFLFRTHLFGKDYVWMKDKYGQIFLEKIPVGEPTSFNIDGQTGEVTPAE